MSKVLSRAGRYLGILVVPRYCMESDNTRSYRLNFRETIGLKRRILSISVLSWFNRVQELFLRLKINNRCTTEDKRLVLANPNKLKRSNHPNRTVNPQAFVKTAINRNIAFFKRYIEH